MCLFLSFKWENAYVHYRFCYIKFTIIPLTYFKSPFIVTMFDKRYNAVIWISYVIDLHKSAKQNIQEGRKFIMKNPNGFGTVYKLSGNRRKPFIARITAGWTEDGKQIYHTIGYFKTRKEANIALAEYNQNPYDIGARKQTFKQVYERWSDRKFKSLSEGRVANYHYMFKAAAEFHDLPFSEITLQQLQEFFDKRTYNTNSTLVQYKTFFNQLYKYALKHDISSKNHAKYIEIQGAKSSRQRTIFTAEEIWTLWDNCDDKNVQLVLILIYSGLRISELLTLEREKVFLDERYMIGGMKTEAGKDRIIPINKRIYPFIEERCSGSGKYLVMNSKNRPYSSYQSFRTAVWRPLMQKFGFVHAIHDTRHTTISLLDAAGANRIAVKRIVGHADSDMTDHYTHKTVEELVAEIDKI